MNEQNYSRGEYSNLSPDYRVGLPAPDDTPEDIATRERMWAGIQQKIRQEETWAQKIRRIVRGLWR